MKTIRIHFADKDDVIALDNVPSNITAAGLMPVLFGVLNETEYRRQIRIMNDGRFLEGDDEVSGTDIILHVTDKPIPWYTVAFNLFVFIIAHLIPLGTLIFTRNLGTSIMVYFAGILCIGITVSLTRPPELSIFKCWRSYRHRETNFLEIVYMFFWAMSPTFRQEKVAMW